MACYTDSFTFKVSNLEKTLPQVRVSFRASEIL
jgi:hypothetical protein